MDAVEYVERRKADQPIDPVVHSKHWIERRKSTRCGCGKWRCHVCNPSSMALTCSHSKTVGSHHTDGSQACETNHRSPEDEVTWQEEHTKWKNAQAAFTNLADVMNHLESRANPLSFDGHDNFTFVVDHPEAAAICIHHMFDTLVKISIGKSAMGEIPVRKSRE